MREKSHTTIVVMPDNNHLEVTYYCSDVKLTTTEKATQTQLFIQLHDCISTLKIEKTLCNKADQLEKIVHNKVISAKGHLC